LWLSTTWRRFRSKTRADSGYVPPGYLLEKAGGESYEEFVQENIFGPLGMKDSGYDSNSAIVPRRATGYAPGKDGPLNAGFVHMTIPFAAGGLYSTTEDLLRWERGLFGGKLLSEASLARMTTPFKNDYASGVSVHTLSGHNVRPQSSTALSHSDLCFPGWRQACGTGGGP